jgi:hypothetical protein
VNRAAEYELAWDLVALATAVLSGEQRNALCTQIGAGQPDDAIRSLVASIGEHLKALPAELHARVTAWLDCYVGSEHEPTLRTIVNGLIAPTP